MSFVIRLIGSWEAESYASGPPCVRNAYAVHNVVFARRFATRADAEVWLAQRAAWRSWNNYSPSRGEILKVSR